MLIICIADYSKQKDYIEMTLQDGQKINLTFKKGRGKYGMIGIDAPKEIKINRRFCDRDTDEKEQA